MKRLFVLVVCFIFVGIAIHLKRDKEIKASEEIIPPKLKAIQAIDKSGKGSRKSEGKASISVKDERKVKHNVQVSPNVSPIIFKDRKRIVSSSGSNREDFQNILKKRGVSKDVLLIIGEIKQAAYAARIRAIHELENDLTREEIKGLYGFFDNKFSEQDALDILAFNALKNDVLNKLIGQNVLHADLGYQIISMYRDKGQDVVWRDYSLQHFSPYYEKKWAPNSEFKEDKERLEFINAFNEALQETDTTIAGTALIHLNILSNNYSEFDQSEIARVATEIASDETTGESTKITALNIAAQLGVTEILPVTRGIAQNGETISLQMAAIAAMGFIGEEADINYLQGILASDSRRLHIPAKAAIKRLQNTLLVEAKAQ